MRKPFKPLVLAAFVAAAAATPAWADDNGMTAGYGDSWAQLQAREPQASTVPGLASQDVTGTTPALWSDLRTRAHRMREATSNTFHRMTGTGYAGDTTTVGTTASGATVVTTDRAATMSNPPDSQAGAAAYSGQSVAPGPAAIDAGAAASGSVRPIPDRGGPLSGPGSSTNTVDPTGVGAATMGGSPYGGNQDPTKLPSQTSTQ